MSESTGSTGQTSCLGPCFFRCYEQMVMLPKPILRLPNSKEGRKGFEIPLKMIYFEV
jgi:hypothetical protein